MMELKDLKDYIDKLENVKYVTPKIEIISEEVGEDEYLIIHTTEVYEFDNNAELLKKIDEVKSLPGFVGIKRKYVAEKLDKEGEVKKPEAYLLIVELDH